MAVDNQRGFFRDVKLDSGGKLFVNDEGTIEEKTSVENSTTTPLSAGATFTGTGELNGFPDIMVTVKTDQDGTLYIDLSTDGINWDSQIIYNYHEEEINPPHAIVKATRYVRVRFVNTSGVDQTFIRLASYFGDFSKLSIPIDNILPQNFDSAATRPTNYNYEVALSHREGALALSKSGYNDDIDTGTETVWSSGGTFTPLASPSTLSIVSTSINDTVAGSGARRILIEGVDVNRNFQAETLILTGIIPAVTATSWLGINNMCVVDAGSGQTNAGDINVTAVSNGSVQSSIPSGVSSNEQLVFFSLAEHKILIDWISLNTTKIVGGTLPRVTVKLLVLDTVLNVIEEIFTHTIDTEVENSIQFKPSQPFVIQEKSVVWMTATTDKNNTVVAGRISGVQVKNR